MKHPNTYITEKLKITKRNINSNYATEELKIRNGNQ